MGRSDRSGGRTSAAEPDCPTCGQPRRAGFRPFCSRRCADLDLGRWLGGGYRIPTEETPDPGAAPPPEEAGE